MTDKITITRKDGAYIVTVDGGSIECQTLGAALDIVRRETGDKAESAEWEKLKTDLENFTAAMVEMTAERDKYKAWWAEAYDENRQLKAAICKWFLRAFKEYCA